MQGYINLTTKSIITGWTDEDAPDEDQLRELGAAMSAAIYDVHGIRYTNQKSIGLYPTTGSADDWMYSDDANEFNGEYRAAAYTIELRDTGSYGFLLPPQYVRSIVIPSITTPAFGFFTIDHPNW